MTICGDGAMVGHTGIGLDYHIATFLKQAWRSGTQDKFHQFDLVAKPVLQSKRQTPVLGKTWLESEWEQAPAGQPGTMPFLSPSGLPSISTYMVLLDMQVPRYPQEAWGWGGEMVPLKTLASSQQQRKQTVAAAAGSQGRGRPTEKQAPGRNGGSSSSDASRRRNSSSSSSSGTEEQADEHLPGAGSAGEAGPLIAKWLKLQKKLRRLLAFGQGKECMRQVASALGIRRQVSVKAPGITRYIVYSEGILQQSVSELGLRYKSMLAIEKEHERRVELAKKKAMSSAPSSSVVEVSEHATLITMASGETGRTGQSAKRIKLDRQVAKAVREAHAKKELVNSLAMRMTSGINVLHVLLVLDFLKNFFIGARMVQRSDAVFFEVQRQPAWFMLFAAILANSIFQGSEFRT